jgi:hypothetical protein
MKINEVIIEGRDGKKPAHSPQDTGEWRFRDKGGYDRTYNLNRIMMAAAMADGKSTKPVDMDQASWVEKYNTARPYTEVEHNMMKSAFKTVDSEFQHTESDHKSREPHDTHKVSPVTNPGPVKRKKSKK